MPELIDLASELYKTLQAREKKLESERAEIARLQNKAKEQIESNDFLSKELKARENRIKDVEDVLELKKTIDEHVVKIKNDQTILSRERSKLNEDISAFSKKVDEETRNIERQKEKLIKQSEELELEKKNYKVKIIESVEKEFKPKVTK